MTEVTSVTLAALRTIPYLQVVPLSELRPLAGQCRVRTTVRGGVIFIEGAPAEGLVVILEGRVKLTRVSARGREQVLHTEGPGATLGEVPVFDGGGYVASAVSLVPARVVVVPRAALLDLCRRRPEVALGVVTVLARRLRHFAELIEDLALRDVTARVARHLADEMRRAGGADVVLAETRDDIAARLGTVRELVSRALSRLRSEGVVSLQGRRVRVLDPRRLAGLADRRSPRPAPDDTTGTSPRYSRSP
jgi:CRP/FNR family transcriptional regulator